MKRIAAATFVLLAACSGSAADLDSDPEGASSAAATTEASSDVRFPAEWEPHESVWLAWPTYENMKGRPSSSVQKEIIRALHGHVKVDLLAGSDDEVKTIKADLDASGVPADHVRMRVVAHNDIWMRDMGALFLKDGGERRVVDTNFNTWGYESTTSKNSKVEEKVDATIAKQLGLATVASKMVSEGGALEFNGRGTMISTEHVVLQRNPGMSLAQIEAEYKRLYNLKKVIWMKRGVMEDDQTFEGPLPGGAYTVITTGGHIDEFARFVGPSKLLFTNVTEAEAKADPIAAETKRRMDENRKILESSTDESGNPIQIVDMPSADPVFETMTPGDGVYDYIAALEYKDGSKFPAGQPVKTIIAASYLNYLVTNGVVVAPKYFKPGRPESTRRKDAAAKAALERAFPGREVVQIDAENVNIGGGGIHCITQQMPALR